VYYHYIINNDSLTEIFESNVSFLESFRKRALEITMFKLHGGEAIILRHKKKAILVDGGEGKKREHKELGEKLREFLEGKTEEDEKLEKKLRSSFKGKAKLEAIVLSHNHQDHSNAISSMLKGDRTILEKNVKFYHQNEPRPTSPFFKKICDQLKKKKIVRVPINEWEDIILPSWKGKFPIRLFCGPKISGESTRFYRSILMRFPFGSATFLFTGDVDSSPTERDLVEIDDTRGFLENVHVLKITHHGSHNGTEDYFLDKTSPFLFFTSSTGDDDEQHNLSKAVECRIQSYVDKNDEKFNVNYYPIFNTHWEGNLIIRTDGTKRILGGAEGILFEVETER